MLQRVRASIARIEAAKKKPVRVEPLKSYDPPVNYWGDWSGYRGPGSPKIADWIKARDPVYNRR